jgi:hypothetical protein
MVCIDIHARALRRKYNTCNTTDQTCSRSGGADPPRKEIFGPALLSPTPVMSDEAWWGCQPESVGCGRICRAESDRQLHNCFPVGVQAPIERACTLGKQRMSAKDYSMDPNSR